MYSIANFVNSFGTTFYREATVKKVKTVSTHMGTIVSKLKTVSTHIGTTNNLLTHTGKTVNLLNLLNSQWYNC